MTPRRQGLCLRLGLGLLAFSALLFFKPLEDAYVLPQRVGLALAALALAAEGFALLAEGQSLLRRCAGGVGLVWLVLVRMSNSRRR